MNYTKPLLLSFLASSLAISILPGMADTTETTIKTTTVTSNTAIPLALPTTGSYLVIDPVTGLAQGTYDPVSRLVSGRALIPGVVIVDATSRKLLATVDPAGNIIDVAVAPAASALIASIDARRKELDIQIADALSKGQITADQAATFRTDLAHIAADEVAASQTAGVVTFQKALTLGYGLNTLENRLIVPGITETAIVKPVIAPQIVVMNGEFTLVDDVTYRRLQLEKRVDDEYTAGRLSNNQVSKLKSDLTRIASLETKYRHDGLLGNSKKKTLEVKLDQIEAALDHDVATINQKRSGIGIRVD